MSTGAPAVLLLVFNRPRHTSQAIAALLRERPQRVYVSGDGPRASAPQDQALIEQVWEVVRSAPWQCEVLEQRSDVNLGCGAAVRAGLDWFFAHEARGLVVEDDVELASGALALAQHLLDVGQDDPQVGAVTVFNTVPSEHITESSASFRRSLFSASQGWGTWADVWQVSPHSPEQWRDWLPEQRMTALGGRDFMRRWRGILDADVVAHQHSSDFSWDFTWQAHLWAVRPICLVSNVNLVRNTGFDAEATFSAVLPSWWPESSGSWSEPFAEPERLGRDVSADAWEGRTRYAISPVHSARRAIADRLPWLAHAYRRARYGVRETAYR